MYQRKLVEAIISRMNESDNPLIQVIAGPRQTGKSTAIAQALEQVDFPAHSVSADDVISADIDWLKTEWQQARNLQAASNAPCILILDEVQKVNGWPNAVKGLWDADRRNVLSLKVVLSGSSSLLLRRELEDSLKGRFEVIRFPHWSFSECREDFLLDRVALPWA